jgi:RNA polymerase sigma factor (sigma-70 family)
MTATPRFSMQLDEEQATAQNILELEEQVRDLLTRTPAGAHLKRGSQRARRTRAAAVDRIEETLNLAASDPTTDPEVLADARQRWKDAQQLRWRLAMSAVRVAHREARRCGGNGALSQPDLVQEGMLGLLAAAKRYEPNRGIRFATYARWWARAAMTRAIDRSRLVRMSGAACEQLRNLRLYIRAVEARGLQCSVTEAAEAVGVDPEYARRLLTTSEVSVDEPSDDSSEKGGVVLTGELCPAPDDAAAHREAIGVVLSAIENVLTEPQRRVVTHRFGLGAGSGETLSEVARGMSLSCERVRQIERQSLDRLREVCGSLDPAA